MSRGKDEMTLQHSPCSPNPPPLCGTQERCSLCQCAKVDARLCLTCSHKYCAGCIDKLLPPDLPSLTACPICTCDNDRMKALCCPEQRDLSLSESNPPCDEWYCYNCFSEGACKVKAKEFCLDCDVSLCEKHLQQHKAFIKKKKHNMLAVCQYKLMKRKFECRRCKVHPKQTLMFVCTKCDQIICQICVACNSCELGGRHEATELEVVSLGFADTINQAMKDVDCVKVQAEKVIDEAHKVFQRSEIELEQLKSCVCAQFEERFNELNREKQNILTKINEMICYNKKQTSCHKNKIQNIINAAKDTTTKANQLLIYNHNVDIAMQARCTLNDLKAVKTTTFPCLELGKFRPCKADKVLQIPSVAPDCEITTTFCPQPCIPPPPPEDCVPCVKPRPERNEKNDTISGPCPPPPLSGDPCGSQPCSQLSTASSLSCTPCTTQSSACKPSPCDKPCPPSRACSPVRSCSPPPCAQPSSPCGSSSPCEPPASPCQSSPCTPPPPSPCEKPAPCGPQFSPCRTPAPCAPCTPPLPPCPAPTSCSPIRLSSPCKPPPAPCDKPKPCGPQFSPCRIPAPCAPCNPPLSPCRSPTPFIQATTPCSSLATPLPPPPTYAQVMAKEKSCDPCSKSVAERTFRYEIHDAINLKKSCSPVFFLKNLRWNLMAEVRQVKRNSDLIDYLAFFIECNSECKSENWSCPAIVDLRLINQVCSSNTYERRIFHTFNWKENDWGYSTFMRWCDVLDPSNGFFKNGSLVLEAHVNAK